jgi:hypothetical protein
MTTTAARTSTERLAECISEDFERLPPRTRLALNAVLIAFDSAAKGRGRWRKLALLSVVWSAVATIAALWMGVR